MNIYQADKNKWKQLKESIYEGRSGSRLVTLTFVSDQVEKHEILYTFM